MNGIGGSAVSCASGKKVVGGPGKLIFTSKLRRHVASRAADEEATYSAFQVDNAFTVCLLDTQTIQLPGRKNTFISGMAYGGVTSSIGVSVASGVADIVVRYGRMRLFAVDNAFVRLFSGIEASALVLPNIVNREVGDVLFPHMLLTPYELIISHD